MAYKNLIPGREYELNLTVMQKIEAGATPLLNADGKPYTATQAFTPETADGVAVVAVTIDSTELAGADLVMFEQLTLNGPTASPIRQHRPSRPRPLTASPLSR